MKALYERICTPYATKSASIIGGLAHAIGSSALGHFTTNGFGRAAHHGSNIGDILAHRGFQHGLLEQSIAPTMKQSIKSVFGPEALINYEAALEAGKKLYQAAPDPAKRTAALLHFTDPRFKIPTGVAALPHIQQAAHHELHGTSPTLQAKGPWANAYGKLLDHLTNNPIHGMETGAQRALKQVQGLAPAGALAAADATIGVATGMGPIPLGAVGHAAWNGMRQLGAATDVGQRVVAHEITTGLHKGMPKTTLYHDLGASPAYLDARRTGATLRDNLGNPRVAKALQGTLGAHIPTPIRPVGHEEWSSGAMDPKRVNKTIADNRHQITERIRRTLDSRMPPAIRVEPMLDRYVPKWNVQIKHEGTR